jgi:dTDP-glucose 4,6-dehydratase
MKLLVTGGAGFIGSNFCKLMDSLGHQILVLDALTYAGHSENLSSLQSSKNFHFVHGNICDEALVREWVFSFKPDVFVNMAAESHVDNSIAGPKAFIQTNILGTFVCLEVCREYFSKNQQFRFVQISTDEVYGTLGDTGKFSEETKYQPTSPYSASKASAHMLSNAWGHTYKMPLIVTHCSNNYGPQQLPEKLIPKTILHCIQSIPIPVYGTGKNIRDWIHVEDHCRGILAAIEKGSPGEHYCFGGNNEVTNLQLVESICEIMDRLAPKKESHKQLIQFVKDRPGHDWRYAVDDTKASRELGYSRQFNDFSLGLKQTVKWYLDHQTWIEQVTRKQKG